MGEFEWVLWLSYRHIKMYCITLFGVSWSLVKVGSRVRYLILTVK